MRKKSKALILAGLLLLAAALSLTAYNLREDTRAKATAEEAVSCLKTILPESEDASLAEGVASPALPGELPGGEVAIPDHMLKSVVEMPVQTVNGQDYVGVLEIPCLSLELPVISEWNDSRLTIAPCRYKGSAYTGDLIIAAHNYRSHFGRLKNLRPGDALTFTDIDGNAFLYEVAELEILKPAAVAEMESGDWDLTLFTCTVGGRSRVILRCVSVKEG
ncbi:MAG: sortase [Christensenellales bacterium]|jgi:sortase A